MVGIQTLRSIEGVIRRDRIAVALGLGSVVLIAWIYVLKIAAEMNAMTAMDAGMAAMGMADMHVWGLGDWSALFVMWSVMMAGMMLPSTAPVMLLVIGSSRCRGDSRAVHSAVAFVGGYLFAWTSFSAVAAALQVWLHRAAVLNAEMASRSTVATGAILIVAGIYQWSPIKKACLTHCQSPLGFLATHWRGGTAGGFRMGVRHGIFCVGCSWALMALLFAVGVMNLLWVAALAAFVLVEKLLPQGPLVGRATGVVLILLGLFELTRA